MIELSRTVRFCLTDQPTLTDPSHPASARRYNTYSAWPPMRGLGRYYELDVTCRGRADPTTGYFINIRQIDEAVRQYALPELAREIAGPLAGSDLPMGTIMQRLLRLVDKPLDHTVTKITLRLTPFVSLEVRNQSMKTVILRQHYEFSAAHRLHVPQFDDRKNRDIFGKCNNPAGHGHNYQLQVAVAAGIDRDGQTLDVSSLDALVAKNVIEKLDHKNLNVDVPEFKTINPTVENIAVVIWQMLKEPVAAMKDTGQAGAETELHEIAVWETPKTICSYRGE